MPNNICEINFLFGLLKPFVILDAYLATLQFDVEPFYHLLYYASWDSSFVFRGNFFPCFFEKNILTQGESLFTSYFVLSLETY